MQRWNATLVVVLALAMPGCGSRDGLTRYKISGNVTHDGKPVHGMIRFSPDSDKGNRGPATMMRVSEGQYRSVDGQGVLSGPYNVEISGYEPLPSGQPSAGVAPKPLFEGYKVSVELDKKDGILDFDVPKKR